MKFVFLLLSILGTGTTGADTLQNILAARLKEESVLPKFETERTWAASGYMPISYFEYRYGRGSDSERDAIPRRRDDENQKYFRVPFSDDGAETHTFRIHFKSLAEIVKSGASRRLSGELIETEKLEITNQRQFNVYMEVVEQSLQSRMQKMLEGREDELHKSVNDSGQMMGLPKVDVKDLVREMERLQKVDAEAAGVKAQRNPLAAISPKEAEEASSALIDSVGALAKKISETQWRAERLQVKRKRLEVKLSRIDKEISWAEDRKIIDHLDFQRNTLERQDTVRIGFNIPFLRFDNENRARDKALLAAKESELQRKETDMQSDLRRRRLEVLSLAAQIESIKSRLARTRGVTNKVKNLHDVELRAVLGDFSFELERDVVLISLKFYTKYLEYLRDEGAFAAYAGNNLLNPVWPQVTL